jgi:hypothetical protein
VGQDSSGPFLYFVDIGDCHLFEIRLTLYVRFPVFKLGGGVGAASRSRRPYSSGTQRAVSERACPPPHSRPGPHSSRHNSSREAYHHPALAGRLPATCSTCHRTPIHHLPQRVQPCTADMAMLAVDGAHVGRNGRRGRRDRARFVVDAPPHLRPRPQSSSWTYARAR